MGDREGWAQPSGLLPNGLLPDSAASATQVLDMERWQRAEDRTAELIACIQPNPLSEDRRHAVANYVQRLIMKCFSCQVFTFGSVPLKTYLPDGDIDLTAFSKSQNLKDTWAQEVRDMLEKEEKSENAEFHVKEVQYIQAEVKIIKCLVENIVVDISFNQLGGLCTLCFLEEVDHLINQNHLFKRSIILIKAWCYYESRILGAHHGLISTYALETLVLYIFHVFNNSFAGPLEVLYRFLEFFSNFDWENFCVSLWGPVPISSLPEMTAEAPLKDGGELLLTRPFLDDCNLKYAVFPGGQENQGQPFVSKHFNVIDPLRTNNNLGRSVSKGNFFRIRSAFAFGAKRLARLLECPKENLVGEVNQFFMNAWERHGSGHRPDAPSPNLWPPQPLKPVKVDASSNHTLTRKKDEGVRLRAVNESLADGAHALHDVLSQLTNTTNYPSESIPRTSNAPTASRIQNPTTNSKTSRRMSEQITGNISSGETMNSEKDQRSSWEHYLVTEHDGQTRYHFARTQSSPELTDTYGETLSRGKQNWHETGKNPSSAARPDHSSKRKNVVPEVSTSHSTRPSAEVPSSLRNSSSQQSLEASVTAPVTDSNSVSNSYHDDVYGLGRMGEELASVPESIGMQQELMNQEEQDLINMMASSRINNFNGQVQVPLNFAPVHLPFPLPPSVLSSMGYAQRNLSGLVPATTIHLIEPSWGSNMHFSQGLLSPSIPHYFPAGFASNPEEIGESGNDNSSMVELNVGDGNGFWNEHETSSSRGFDAESGSFQMLVSDDRQQSISSLASTSGSSSSRSQHKLVKENRSLSLDDHSNVSYHHIDRGNDFSSDRNTNFRFLPGTRASSSRNKAAPESSWDGSSTKLSKSTRDKRGRKTAPSAASPAYWKVRNGGWQHESVDRISSPADDENQELTPFSIMGTTEMAERSMGIVSAAMAPVRGDQLSCYEPSQMSGTDSTISIAPMLVGSSSRQRTGDNNGVMPFTFYPTGPPVPFLTMLPVYNFPTDAGNSDEPASHFGKDDRSVSSSTNHSDLTDCLEQSEIPTSSTPMKVASVDSTDQHKPDILNSDFLSHLQNLQYGRLCQNSRYHVPWIYPSSVMAPPVYLQGHFPWDGPGRPPSGNVNLFTQLMSYGGPRLVPVAPLQPGTNRSAGSFQHYGDHVPRYRGGTGTYLPNPKVAFRDRQSSTTKSHRGNYSYERNEHDDREGNWNFGSKMRSAGRNYWRNQAEKPSSRSDRFAADDSRAESPWDSYRHEPMASFQAPNGPLDSTNSLHTSANVAYGMYPLPSMNANGVTPTGPAVPSVVMLYPYDHNTGYNSQTEHLDFGAIGPVHFAGMNEALPLGESGQVRAMYDQRHSPYQGSSAQSSPDQPSSPQLQR